MLYKATVNSAKVAATLTDYPAFIPLSGMPSSFWSNILGGSIREKLLAYWQLENVNDSWGAYTLTNNGTTTFAAGKLDNAASLNGSSQSLNNNSVWGASAYPRSYFGWVKFDTVSADQAIFAIGDGSVHYYALRIRASDSHIVFRSNNNTEAADVDTGIVASTGTWYHVAVVQHSSTSVSLYVNGTKTNTTATTYVATVSQFYIGYLGRGGFWYLDGMVDEVGFCNGALTDAEVTLLYNSGTGRKGHLTLAGGDIRCYSDEAKTTELAREVVACDTSNSTGELHVKVPSLTTSTIIYIDVDGARVDYEATATYGRNNVWSTNYKLVHHMQDTRAKDSTSNANDGTLTAMDSTNVVTGKLDAKGFDFNGTDEYVTRGTDDAELDMSTSPFSVSLIINSDVDEPIGVFSKKLADVDGGWEFYRDGTTPCFRLRNSGNKDYKEENLILAADGWALYHIIGDTSNGVKIYKNGSLITLDADAGAYTSVDDTSNPFMYGRAEARGYFDGQLDEMRVNKGTALSANWITTEYNNLMDVANFWTLAENSTNVTVSATTVTATVSTPAPSISGGASVASSVVTATFSTPAPAISGDANVPASVVTAVFSLPAPNIITPDAQVDASVVTATFSTPAPTVQIDTVTDVGVQTITASIPSASVQIDFTHDANVQVATFSIPAPTISAESNITVTPDPITLTFSLPAPTVTGEINAMVEVGVLTATFSLPAPTITAIRNVTVDASVLTATFGVFAPRKVGGLWTAQPRVEGTWTPQARVI